MDMDMVRPPEQSGANHHHLSLLFVGMQILGVFSSLEKYTVARFGFI
jgi:hypothetical protein